MSDYKPTGKSAVLFETVRRPCTDSPCKVGRLTQNLPENDGLRKDGQPDQRMNTGRKSIVFPYIYSLPCSAFGVANEHAEFAQGKVDPVEAGKQGGHASGDSSNDNSSSGGSGGGKGQFAGGKVDPVEAGKKGGNS